jgi:hypothetical protein
MSYGALGYDAWISVKSDYKEGGIAIALYD